MFKFNFYKISQAPYKSLRLDIDIHHSRSLQLEWFFPSFPVPLHFSGFPGTDCSEKWCLHSSEPRYQWESSTSNQSLTWWKSEYLNGNVDCFQECFRVHDRNVDLVGFCLVLLDLLLKCGDLLLWWLITWRVSCWHTWMSSGCPLATNRLMLFLSTSICLLVFS